MADEDGDDLELAESKGKGSKSKLIILIVSAVLLLGGGAGAGLYITGALASAEKVSVDDEDEMEDEDEEEEQEAAKAAAIYVDLHPAFTVNLQAKSKARFLQASVQVLTREPKVEEQIKQHSPMIRNRLMLLFSGKTSQELSTVEGKETLQQEARSAIENVLKAETSKGGVEAVFFTSFVMQ